MTPITPNADSLAAPGGGARQTLAAPLGVPRRVQAHRRQIPRAAAGRFSFFSLSFALLLTCLTAPAAADDARLLDGLRQRRLFELAEHHCRTRLADPTLAPQERAELTIELIRTLAEHAVHALPPDRGPLWQAARQEAAEFDRRHAGNPRRLLVRVQDALTLLARGQLERTEAEVGAGGVTMEDARRSLREAIDRLQMLESEAALAVRERHRLGPPAPGELSAARLISLQRNVQYQSAMALQNLGATYASGSADRANALTQALDRLQPLAALPEDDPLRWPARVDQAVCNRLLGRLGEASEQLAALEAAAPTAEAALRVRAEQARLFLAANRPQQALEVLAAGREIDGQTSAELDLAHLETFLALWQAAAEVENTDEAARWQQQAAEATRQIERLHGPYWARRAETLLASAAGAAAGNVDLLERTAQAFYRRGELDDAVAAYAQAGEAARRAGHNDLAFDLGLKAAAIEHQRDRRAEAVERFRRLALEMPTHPRAAEVHLLAAVEAAQLARADAEALAAYVELLGEHLNRWPQSATAAQAAVWLGRLHEAQGDWEAAADAYRKASPAGSEYAAAIVGAARATERLLAAQQAAGQPSAPQAREAAQWFEAVYLGPGRQLPETWDAPRREAAVAAARLRLTHAAEGYDEAARTLAAALAADEELPPDWQADAQALRVVALAGGGRAAEAQQQLAAAVQGEPRRVLEMIEALARLRKKAAAAAAADLARLELAAYEQLGPRREALAGGQRALLDRLYADALAAAGRSGEALRHSAQLAAAHPDDAEMQQVYAEMLLEQDDRASLAEALAQWRRVAARSVPQSPRWYRARYAIALAHYRLGDKQEAARVIRYLQTLHPDLGGPAMRREFLDLLRQCE